MEMIALLIVVSMISAGSFVYLALYYFLRLMELEAVNKELERELEKEKQKSMSNIKPTIRLEELIFLECVIDLLFREDKYCVQIADTNGRILQRQFHDF
ncbi:MAG: hypothetical protein KAX49_14095 [Halanaerobiales bacterium]|nr:hypothetical protein [Halanaerobiales bacterium]